MKSFQLLVAFLLSLVVASVAHALPAPSFRTVALTGQHAPGLPNDTSFSTFEVPSINNSGQVSFAGTLAGPAREILTTNDSGFWTEGTGRFTLLAREGDAAAGATAGQVYNDFNGISPNIADSGDIAWRGWVRSSTSPQLPRAIWSGNVGTLKMHAIVGGDAPGLPSGVTISAVTDTPVINSQGALAYRAIITGAGVDSTNELTLWSTTGGTPHVIARQGDPAPGTSANFGTLWSVRLNDAGQVAISADLTTTENGSTPESGWWLSNGNVLSLVVKDFSPAPGLAGAEFNIGQSSPISHNATGQYSFKAFMRQSATLGINVDNDSGIWTNSSGSLQLLVREGSQAPGVVAGGTFFGFDPPKLSDGGETAFTASLTTNALLGITPSNNSGLWSDSNGNLQLVARAGFQAPGMPTGALFNSFVSSRSSVSFTLNADGHAAFLTSVTGGGVTGANDTGLWAQDQYGNLRLIIREGDLFEVAPGDFRTISLISFQSQSAGGEGLARGFSDNYQLALHLFFTNNTSGVFVTSITVPEPGGLGPCLVALVGLLTRRKRRG